MCRWLVNAALMPDPKNAPEIADPRTQKQPEVRDPRQQGLPEQGGPKSSQPEVKVPKAPSQF